MPVTIQYALIDAKTAVALRELAESLHLKGGIKFRCPKYPDCKERVNPHETRTSNKVSYHFEHFPGRRCACSWE
jgi:hypothetical protein